MAPVAAAAFTVTLISGCTDVARALNKGGDTTCSEYLNQGADDRRMTITKFIKQESGSDAEPAGTAVDFTILSVNGLCQLPANADKPLKSFNQTGIIK
ncbi:hypothetical protein H0264_23240 [Nocardia huaxiensis]|uniref:Acid stress chaperone HdeA n=2 Tax=Nocardia huaxiensis TaxID=2755382 RepID=A0A7D7A2W6_9NOCA|nr:hypothetical protein H0264_23240 [Nocardia huaxiensis]